MSWRKCWKALRYAQHSQGSAWGSTESWAREKGTMEEPGVKQGFDKEMKRSLPGKESGQQM